MLAVIDNYDSFTFNLVQYLGELGADVAVYRNDQIDIETLTALSPDKILLSPGPGRPDDAGITLDVVSQFAGRVPIMGVCLGHQSIGQAYACKIVHAKEIMHGKLSTIHHKSSGVFAGLDGPFEATRYHSLVLDKSSVPDCLEVTAWTLDKDGNLDEIMGVRHKTQPIEGVQFHPESISSQHGHHLLRNFLEEGRST